MLPLHHAWTLTTRFAAVASTLATLAILGVGSVAWVKARDNLTAQHESQLKQEAAIIAEHTSDVLNSIATTMEAIAGNSVLATALVDSAGKETYLLPFLHGFQTVNGIPIRLAFTDFEAKLIGTNGAYRPSSEELKWLAEAMEGKGPRAAVVGHGNDGPFLLAAEWVLYSRTSTPEGAVLYSFPLSAVLARPGSRIHYAADGTRPHEQTVTREGDTIVVHHPMRTVAVLEPLGFHLELTAPLDGTQAASLQAITLVYAAASLIAVAIIFLTSHFAGRRLTADLRNLSDFTAAVVQDGFPGRRVVLSSSDEVAQVGRGVNFMLDELERLYTELADTSRLALAEERGRLAYAQRIGHLGNFDYDHTTRTLKWSDETFAIFGFPRPAAPGLDDFLARVPGDERSRLLDELNTAQPGDTIDHCIVLPGGHVRYVHTTVGDVVRAPDGTPLRLKGIVQDITERRLAEKELAVRSQELQRSNRELEAFAYVASHDLRQPLRTISSYLQLIKHELGDGISEDLRTFIGFAVNGAKRMDRLILDLLQYSRIGRDDSFGPVSLAEAVSTALLNLELVAQETGAEITVADGLPTVAGSTGELVRLFQNLIGNALKYRAPGRVPKVDIGFDRNGGEWRIWVADNGIGIAPEQHDRAFQIFQRLVGDDKYEGTGIGLAVCAKIVSHHGGHIWIESNLGEGARFLFTLPVDPL